MNFYVNTTYLRSILTFISTFRTSNIFKSNLKCCAAAQSVTLRYNPRLPPYGNPQISYPFPSIRLFFFLRKSLHQTCLPRSNYSRAEWRSRQLKHENPSNHNITEAFPIHTVVNHLNQIIFHTVLFVKSDV